ncbi:helix-turn-helix domain-containing protein [bacterium]|nr:helix-turn-helix domain-containing protein [bacterium]
MRKQSEKYNQAVAMYEQGMSVGDLARYYRITRQAMHKILKRRGAKFRSNLRYGAKNHFYRGTKASDRAQNLLEKAIEKGIVERKTYCENCGDTGTFKDGRTKIQAHHSDYSQPLKAKWLCQKCHHKWHKKNKAKEAK